MVNLGLINNALTNDLKRINAQYNGMSIIETPGAKCSYITDYNVTTIDTLRRSETVREQDAYALYFINKIIMRNVKRYMRAIA